MNKRFMKCGMIFFGLFMVLALHPSEEKKKAIADKSVQCMYDYYVRVIMGVPAIKLTCDSDVEYVSSDLKATEFNYVLANRFKPENATQRVKEVARYYRERNLPFSFWIGHGDSPTNLREILLSQGFSQTNEYYNLFLAMENYKRKERLIQSNLKLEYAQNQSHMFDFACVHGFSPHFYEKVWGKIALHQVPYKCIIGYVNCVPVAAGIVHFYKDMSSIHSIAVSRDHHNKGYGRILVYALLEEVKRRKLAYVTTNTTKAGIKFFKAFGFEESFTLREYVPPAILS